MSYLTKLLSSVKNNLYGYLILATAAFIGTLVAALKVQGSRLHRAQVDLLDAKLKPTLDLTKAKEAEDFSRYQKALESYLKAGGTLLLCLFLASPTPALAEVKECQEALSACDTLQRTQAEHIRLLEDANAQWRRMAEKAPGDSPLPLIISSGASGAVAGALMGATLGLGIGAGVGLAIGFIIDRVR